MYVKCHVGFDSVKIQKAIMNVTEENLYETNSGVIELKWEEVRSFVLASLMLAITIFMNFIFKKIQPLVAHFPEPSILIFVGVLFGGLFVHCM